MSIVRKTQSLCPQCLRVLDAVYVQQERQGREWTLLQKNCPEHGHFSVPIWVNLPQVPSFNQWVDRTQSPQHPALPNTDTQQGCPYDCGLCPEHAQHTCCALIEVTQRCNLQCPLCYAAAHKEQGEKNDPSLQNIADSLDTLLRHAGKVNVQLSGGEPTIRQDLPQIIAMAKKKGFSFVQLNTNGLRLATHASYAHELKKAGLSLVYLQWDDMQDSAYKALRGRALTQEKEQALQHCLEANLSVVLVVTVVKGINDTALGPIIYKALASGPLVRGVHIQPASFFGRYPQKEHSGIASYERMTIPEVLYQLEQQSQGMIKASHFQPPHSEHALCSFNAVYTRQEGALVWHAQSSSCCCAPQPILSATDVQGSAAKRAQEFVAQHWGPISPQYKETKSNDFDSLLGQVRHRFTLSGMAFQDAYSLDLERLRRCHIHIVGPQNTIIPFCAYNLTSTQNFSLYRGR